MTATTGSPKAATPATKEPEPYLVDFGDDEEAEAAPPSRTELQTDSTISTTTTHPNPFLESVATPTPTSPTLQRTTATTTTTAVPPTPAAPRDVPNLDHVADLDPSVAALKSMFPDFDVVVLQSVLQSANGNQEWAVEMLLGMNDPSYVPQRPQVVQQRTQTELDEELARRLMLEDRQAFEEFSDDEDDPRRRRRNRPARPPQDPNYVPYQPRSRGQPRTNPYADPNAGAGQRDTLTEVQEQFKTIAETGKRTVNNIFSKVMTKYQEFEQSRATANQNRTAQGNYGGGSVGGSNQGYQQSYQPPPQPPSQTPRWAYTPQQSDTVPPPARQVAGPPAIPGPKPIVQPQTAAPAPPRTPSPQFNLSAGTVTPPPPSTITGSPPTIDRSKIGMLPRRPVSLLPQATSPVQRRMTDDDDEEDLDYVENPFEEHRR